MRERGSGVWELLPWLAAVVSLCIVSSWVYPIDTPPARKVNFLFILADDLGWSDLGCYGADLHETPNIDRLARQGVRFTQAYAASPVCTPTRASIMTGRHPARLHMTIWREATLRPPRQDWRLIPPQCISDLPHEEVTIAEALRSAGYQTAHVGKWHLGDASYYPETQGFDVNIGGTHWGAPNSFFYPYRGAEYFREYRYVPDLAFGKQGEYLTDRLTDEGIQVLERMKEGPFFLQMAYHTVHSPIEGKPGLVEYYKKRLIPKARHKNPIYAAMVHSLDENVGRILDRIERLGIAERTVVVLFSDNGGVANQIRGQFVTDNNPLRSGKGSLYEGGIRVPLIIRWPAVTDPGSICDQPISSIDFYPTFSEIAGLPAKAEGSTELDGISFVSLLRNPESKLDRRTLYWHYPHYYPTTTPVSAIRLGDWKLMEYFEDGRIELYDLSSDSSEDNNLLEKEPSKAREMRALLENWRAEIGAQIPRPNTAFRNP